MTALGRSMVGNVQDSYRIDGWSEGKWLEGPDGVNATELVTAGGEFISVRGRTLTLNLEDGSVDANRYLDERLGAVCQGGSGVSGQDKDCGKAG